MTDERRRNLERARAYVARLQPFMRLQHWDITVEEEPPDNENADAACWTANRCHIARLRFADRHFGRSPAEQAATVAHELIHIHTSEWETATREAFAALDPTGREWATERYEHAMERAIDSLSRVLAPSLPLPDADEGGA